MRKEVSPATAPDAQKESEPRLVSTLHFLVHPGWLYWGNALNSAHGPTRLLMEKYINRANKLPADELMVAFAPAIDEKFVRAFRKKTAADQTEPAFASIINELKKILGERLIVLADSDEPEDSHRGASFKQNQDKIWKKIKTIAENRGFRFSDNLTGKAYGELIGACVRLVAEHMHEASGMKEPIVIEADLTDYPMQLYHPAKQIAELERESPGQYISLSPRVKIDFGMQKGKT